MSAKGSARGSGTPDAGFRRAIEERSITFVLGAGVSKPRGVPDWRELTRRLWTSLLGVNDVPSWLRDRSDALTFANRVMAQALHDSTCLFVGVSMYDVNLIRWLGIRYNAICEDIASQSAYRKAASPERAGSRARDALQRHFWIRTDESDPHGLISALLLERGVRAVPLEAWGRPFEELMMGAFGLRAATKKRATAAGNPGRPSAKNAGLGQKST